MQSPMETVFKVDIAGGSPQLQSAAGVPLANYDKLSTSDIVVIVSALAAERMKSKALKIALVLLGTLSVVLLGAVCGLSWAVAATVKDAAQQAHGSMLVASDTSATMASLAAASGLSASTSASLSTATAGADSTNTAASSTERSLPELLSSASSSTSSHGRSLLALPGFSGTCGSGKVAVDYMNCAQAANWCYSGLLTPTQFDLFRSTNIKCQPANCNNPPTWTSGNLAIQMWDSSTNTFYAGTVNTCYSANSAKAFDFCCPY